MESKYTYSPPITAQQSRKNCVHEDGQPHVFTDPPSHHTSGWHAQQRICGYSHFLFFVQSTGRSVKKPHTILNWHKLGVLKSYFTYFKKYNPVCRQCSVHTNIQIAMHNQLLNFIQNTQITNKFTSILMMYFNQHVSFGTPAIFRVILLLQEYKTVNCVTVTP
jgi:hypothetical protein